MKTMRHYLLKAKPVSFRRGVVAGVVLVALLYLAFSQNSCAKQVDAVRAVAKAGSAGAFERKVERYFKAGDRLLMPLGFYAVAIQRTDEVKHLIESGISFVHRYSGPLSLKNSRSDIAYAAKAGAPLALNFHASAVRLSPATSSWQERIEALVGEKQAVMWYLPEEPGLENLPKLKELADLVRRLDKSDRLVTTYLKSDSRLTLARASSFLDCIMYGAYPGTRAGLPRMRVAYRIDKAYQSGAPAVIAALEAFKNKTGWVDPNHVEFDAYVALIRGAKGICWYCHAQVRENPALLEAVLDVCRVLNGPEYVGEALLRGSDSSAITARQVSGPLTFPKGVARSLSLHLGGNVYSSVQWRAVDHLGKTYILAANCCEVMKRPASQADKDARTVEVEFKGAPEGSEIKLLDGTGEYSHKAGLLSVRLEPLEVAVFKISPQSSAAAGGPKP